MFSLAWGSLWRRASFIYGGVGDSRDGERIELNRTEEVPRAGSRAKKKKEVNRGAVRTLGNDYPVEPLTGGSWARVLHYIHTFIKFTTQRRHTSK